MFHLTSSTWGSETKRLKMMSKFVADLKCLIRSLSVYRKRMCDINTSKKTKYINLLKFLRDS